MGITLYKIVFFLLFLKLNKIVFELPNVVRVYEDGRVERLSGEDFQPPGLDLVTAVESKDVNISFSGDHDELPKVSARVYLPKIVKIEQNKLPLLVYFHGGGFIIESAFNAKYHKFMNTIAAESNVVVVSINYRRAPENPLPAAYEDAWLAIKWIVDSPDSWLKDHADFNKAYFGGDSAGGNLAHQMALKVGLENLKGLNLVGIFLNCPYFWGKEPVGYEVFNPLLKILGDKVWLFLYPNSTGLDDPLINPAMDPNLSSLGCTRVLVIVGGKDPVRSRGWYYKETLEKTSWGGEIEVVEFKEEDHDFNIANPDSENAVKILKMLVGFFNYNGI